MRLHTGTGQLTQNFLRFLAIAIAGCAADLLTKAWAFAQIQMPGMRPPQWIVPGVLGFETSLNEGALWGIGQGKSWLFAIFSLVALAAVLIWFCAGGGRSRLVSVALGSIAAGILGNLYDRLGMPGLSWHFDSASHRLGDPVFAVRDWILLMLGPYHWPNFNIADALLLTGAGIILLYGFRQPASTEKMIASASTDRG